MYFDSRDYAARSIRTAVRQRCRLTSPQSPLRSADKPLQRASGSTRAANREDELIALIDFEACILKLKPGQRLLLWHRYAEGHTTAECATLSHRSLRSTLRDISEALISLEALLLSAGIL